MSPVVIALMGSLFGLGVVHALGPDHVAALTVLAGSSPSPRAVVLTSLRFALGHAGVLFAAACAAFGLGFVPSEGLMRVAEVAGGLTLIGVGAATLHAAVSHRRTPGHRHRSGWLGSLFATSGTRSLILAVPAAATGNVASSLAVTAAFGAGVITGMAGMGLLLGAGASHAPHSARFQRAVGASSGAFAMAVGSYWTVAHFAF